MKLCLHSHFPRLHRSWIEQCLKHALTRKGSDPQAGLRRLCQAENLFERADAIAAQDIEIVCVTSPVIETGNDLDFDYAILDPISLRSIVQASGRVRRHRSSEWSTVNTLILGRSPVAIQGGKLAQPGVETALPRETHVSSMNLSEYPERIFRDLAGDVSFDRINASPLLSDGGHCPLRNAEARIRQAMLALSGEGAPLGIYLKHPVARMNTKFTRTRMFRRSTTQIVRYALSGDGLADAVWHHDASFGYGPPAWCELTNTQLHVLQREQHEEQSYLFTNILERAWQDLCPGGAPMTDAQMRELVTLDVPIYDQKEMIIPVMTYGEQTGFTRNRPEDLLGPFGSAK